MERLFQTFAGMTGIRADVLKMIVGSVAILVILAVIRLLTLRLVWRRSEDARVRYAWRKATAYIGAFLGLLLLGVVWFAEIRSSTFLGLMAAGLAIALRDIVANGAGWFFIVWRRPFGVGDRIQIGENAGDVVDIRFFEFTLMEIGAWVDADQSTGRVVHVPNATVFTKPVANYSRGFEYIWNEAPVLVTFESNWEKAKEILLRIAAVRAEHLSDEARRKVIEAGKRFMIVYSTLTPTVYTSVKESGVLLTVRYLTKPRQRRGTEQAIWEDILREFGKRDDIDFAYPTQRFFNNAREAKRGLRPGAPKPDGNP